MIIVMFVIIFFLLVLLNIPIAFSLGVSTVVGFGLSELPLKALPFRVWRGLEFYSLVAIPLFIFAGELMSQGGIINRLLEFAKLFVGKFRGGLYYVNILVSMLFGGINGAAVADTSAVGAMLIPPTIKEYKDPPLAAAVTACSSVVGPMIPPSVPMLLYAMVAGNVSVGALFLAGIIPGVMLGFGMMLILRTSKRISSLSRSTETYSFKKIVLIIAKALPVALLPAIMVGGIVSGIFTPAESGCAAVLYALFAGFFITRELNFKKLFEAGINTVLTTAVVFFIVAIVFASLWFLNLNDLSTFVSEKINAVVSSQFQFLLLVMVIYLIAGMFLDPGAGIIMFVPVLLPIALHYGVNPIQFGLITCLAMFIGLVTPPVGLCLFLAGDIANTSIDKVFRAAFPLIFLELIVLVIVAFFPASYMWIPDLFY